MHKQNLNYLVLKQAKKIKNYWCKKFEDYPQIIQYNQFYVCKPGN